MMAEEHHLFRGLGLASFVTLAPQYGFVVGDITMQGNLYHTHCMYLDILLHYGIVGCILFGWLMIQHMISLWRSFLKSKDIMFKYLHLALFCSFTGFYIHAVLDFSLYNITFYWVYLGLSIAVRNIERNEAILEV